MTIDAHPHISAPDNSAPDASDTPDAPTALARIVPAFAPVPRAMKRHDGWKPEVQRAFIQALAETGSVRAACAKVKRAEVGAYVLRRHPEAEEFRRAWDAALDVGLRRIEDVAMDRALNGHEQPVYSYGKLVGTRTVYNDRLLMFMLRNRAPERFGGGLRANAGASGNNAVDQMALARLKRQWQKEYEAELAAKEEKSSEEILHELNARFERQHLSWLAALSPHVRALYEAYKEAEHEEEEEARALPPLPLLPGVYWHKERRRAAVENEEADSAEAN